MPFKKNSFDIIISNSTLDNMPSRNVDKALKEMHRVLAKSGILLLTLDNAENPFYSFFYFISKKFGLVPFYQDKCYKRKEIIKLLDRNNFKLLNFDSLIHIITPANFIIKSIEHFDSNLANHIAKFFIGLENLLSNKHIKFKFGWFIVAIARKK